MIVGSRNRGKSQPYRLLTNDMDIGLDRQVDRQSSMSPTVSGRRKEGPFDLGLRDDRSIDTLIHLNIERR